MLEYPSAEAIFVAGQRAPAGRYVRIDSAPPRFVVLTEEDTLPASLDGHVAAYRTLPPVWPIHFDSAASGSSRVEPRSPRPVPLSA